MENKTKKRTEKRTEERTEERTEKRTEERRASDYAALGDSIALIEAVIAGTQRAEFSAQERQECVDSNTQHLELMRAKEDWGSESFDATDEAIEAGNDYIAD